MPVNRLERRKQRTRAALIKAAQTFIAAGKVNVPVLEITQAADVGMGSFYNHFESKEQLFDAAVAEVLDAHGALLDQLTASLDDPAETFACSFRLTGRLFRRRPQESQILLANGMALLSSELRSRTARAARHRRPRAGGPLPRSTTPNSPLRSPAARCSGSATCCGNKPERDVAAAADAVDRRRFAIVRRARRRGARHLSAAATRSRGIRAARFRRLNQFTCGTLVSVVTGIDSCQDLELLFDV